MKRIILSLLISAALAGCSKSGNEPGNPETRRQNAHRPERRNPDRHRHRPDSRASVETGTQFTAGAAGWETAGTAVYSDAATWYTTASVTASTTAQPVTLAAPQVYHANDNIKTYMKAWYPAGAPAGGKVTFSNTDGTVDALLAGEVAGSKRDNTGKVLQFAHKTTQLKFKAVADASLAAGTTVDKITVLNAQFPPGSTWPPMP